MVVKREEEYYMVIENCHADSVGTDPQDEYDLKGSADHRIKHNPGPWLDIDLKSWFQSIRFENEAEGRKFLGQMGRDALFLSKLNLMDYSWLPRIQYYFGTEKQQKAVAKNHALLAVAVHGNAVTGLVDDEKPEIRIIIYKGAIIDLLQKTKFLEPLAKGAMGRKEISACKAEDYAPRFAHSLRNLFPMHAGALAEIRAYKKHSKYTSIMNDAISRRLKSMQSHQTKLAKYFHTIGKEVHVILPIPEYVTVKKQKKELVYKLLDGGQWVADQRYRNQH